MELSDTTSFPVPDIPTSASLPQQKRRQTMLKLASRQIDNSDIEEEWLTALLKVTLNP